MKVILSVEPVRFPLTGIGRYTYELGRGLARAGLDSLWYARGVHLSRSLPRVQEGEPLDAPSGLSRQARRLVGFARLARLYGMVDGEIRGMALRRRSDHVYHGPNYRIPRFPGPRVVTIHDLSVHVWPESHPVERVQRVQADIAHALRHADAIITDTAHTRHEVAQYFGYPEARIHAVQLASGEEFFPRAPEVLEEAFRAHGLGSSGLTPGAYTLYVGTVEPRKNLPALLDAYASLPKAIRTRWPLVIVGYRGWGTEDLHVRMEKAQHEGWLRYLGFVPHDALPMIMAGARVFAYPSRYEGFGLPVLEAMASGVPVVCSNASTLPEVGGDAPAYHAPDDVDALKTALETALEDDLWRAEASARGLRQASRFSWDRCARETVAVYRSVMR